MIYANPDPYQARQQASEVERLKAAEEARLAAAEQEGKALFQKV